MGDDVDFRLGGRGLERTDVDEGSLDIEASVKGGEGSSGQP